MTETIKEEILAIRDTGATNMLDVQTVQRMAYEMEYFDLVMFIEDHRHDYINFIITGRE